MKYLGINITTPIDKAFEANGPLLLKKIKEDIRRWTVLPISLWGRAEVIKMNILPRIAFLISSLPLQFPPHWFKEINKSFTGFLWNNKKPRIGYKKLMRPRNRGGLGIPDVKLYYLSYNARFPLAWGYGGGTEICSWKWTEEQILSEYSKNISLESLWFHPKISKEINNPIFQFSCEVARSLQKLLVFQGISLPSCPVWLNPILTAGGKCLSNKAWQTKGIDRVDKIVKDGEMIPFNELKDLYDLRNSDFLIYLQLSSIIGSIRKDNQDIGMKKELDDRFRKITLGKRFVSQIYSLLSLKPADDLETIRQQWESDLALPLSTPQWETILKNTTKLSKCVRYKIIQFKILHRVCITPCKIKKMDQTVSDIVGMDVAGKGHSSTCCGIALL